MGIRVVHIVGGDIRLGAHRGAYWLHRGLQEIGIDSTVIAPLDVCDDGEQLVAISKTRLDRMKDRLVRVANAVPILPYRNRSRTIFSTGIVGRSISRHPAIRCADVVHIHWVAKGPISVRGIGRLAKPVVCTMRDMWPFTGGCHYAMECENYRHGCGACPQLGSQRNMDLSKIMAKIKKNTANSNMIFVGISRWLTECAKMSEIVRDSRVTTIPNCIDSSEFFEVNKWAAREQLGIKNDKYVVLAGAHALLSFYKGFDLLVQAINSLDPQKYRIVLFGKIDDNAATQFDIECEMLGHIDNNEKLSTAYSAAHVFVAPSRQEAFGKTLVESMACGTPVACFDATGPKDIVEHGQTGFKAYPFDYKELAHGIEWICERSEYQVICANAKRHAVEKFDKNVIASEYETLYRRMIDQ